MPSLHFKGKTFVDNHHLSVPFHELRPVARRGTHKTASLHDNLVVHGDNLAALKALLPTYHNKVKCIYTRGSYWRYSKEKLMELDADNRIWWGKDRNQVPAIKRSAGREAM